MSTTENNITLPEGEQYQNINWGWLNDYNGQKFAPITFIDQIYTEDGKKFSDEYHKQIDEEITKVNETIKNGTVNGAYKLVNKNDNQEDIDYKTEDNVPVYFKDGKPIECEQQSLQITIGNAEPQTLNIISNPNNPESFQWSSNDIGFFGLKERGELLKEGEDLNNLYTPGAYYSPNENTSKTLANLPEDVKERGFRLMVMSIYEEENNVKKYVIQFIFSGTGTGNIFMRQSAFEEGDNPTWNKWHIIPFSENVDISIINHLKKIQLTGDVAGTVDIVGGENGVTEKIIIDTTFDGSILNLQHDIDRTNPTETSDKYLSFTDKNGLKMGHIHNDYSNNTNRTYMRMVAYAPTTENLSAGYYVFVDKDGNTEAGVYDNGSENIKKSSANYRGDSKIVFMGAAWNDYAEFRDQQEKIEPGYCVASTNQGKVYKTIEKFQACDGIVSDTYGFAIGRTEQYQTPLAVSGRVLAYYNGNREDYNAGDTVCAGPDGKICKMTREEIREYPDRIIGLVSEIPEYEEWNGKKVNGRIWIKVK